MRRRKALELTGTTNADTFLVDETGNRRFWPATVLKVDLLAKANAAGIELWHIGGKLTMTAARKPGNGFIARIKAAKLVFIAHLESEADELEPSSLANQSSAKANPFPAPDTSDIALLDNEIVVRAIRDQCQAYREVLAHGAILA